MPVKARDHTKKRKRDPTTTEIPREDAESKTVDSYTVLNQLTWRDLNISPNEMTPCYTLVTGQCFNWQRIDNSNVWVGVIGKRPFALRQEPTTTFYACLQEGVDDSEQRVILQEYFQLNHSISELYEEWSTQCPRMKIVTTCIPGVRVVRQDPWECLASFIFSSNNNIKRITKGLQGLRAQYGEHLCTLHWTASDDAWRVSEDPILDGAETERIVPLYSFPSAAALLANSSEEKLRALGMGYRARFLIESSRHVCDMGGEQWLLNMRSREREEVQKELITLCGVGLKVADCVALFSLDQADAVPVDTHVWDIAIRDYAPSLAEAKSLTPTVYSRVGDIFREIFPKKAGWAHSVLFAAELPEFRSLLPSDVQEEMKNFVVEQKAKKQALKKKQK